MAFVERTSSGTITPRDIAEHVARFRLTTNETLRRTLLRGRTVGAVRKVLARMLDSRYLQGFPLFYPTRYYVLGSAGAQSLGLGIHRTLPLGAQSLPTEYAILVHALHGKRTRNRLTRPEIFSLCPWLTSSLAAMPHCFDPDEHTVELLRVDLGGRPDHVARKCLADINERRRLPEFMPFVRTGKVRFVLVTATKQKAIALRSAIDRHDWPSELPIHFSIVSDLLALTARKRNA